MQPVLLKTDVRFLPQCWHQLYGESNFLAVKINKVTFYLILPMLLPIAGYSQSSLNGTSDKDSTIDQLTSMIEIERSRSERLDYLMVSKEMALRSVELADSIFQTLVSIQSFKFLIDHDGDPRDKEVYRALHEAMTRLKIPDLENFSISSEARPEKFREIETCMAQELCGRIERNMTLDEWNRFASHLSYEQTCNSFLQRADN